MAMRTVSFRVKKRFPDLQHLVDAGLMRPDELKVRKSNFGKKALHSVQPFGQLYLTYIYIYERRALLYRYRYIIPPLRSELMCEISLILTS